MQETFCILLLVCRITKFFFSDTSSRCLAEGTEKGEVREVPWLEETRSAAARRREAAGRESRSYSAGGDTTQLALPQGKMPGCLLENRRWPRIPSCGSGQGRAATTSLRLLKGLPIHQPLSLQVPDSASPPANGCVRRDSHRQRWPRLPSASSPTSLAGRGDLPSAALPQ